MSLVDFISLDSKPMRRALKGFTLIEIVVATFIMAIFTVLVLGVSSGVLQIWGNAAGRVESTRESRQVLSTIESDFDGIVYNSDGDVLHYETETLTTGGATDAFDPVNQARLILVTSTLDAPDSVAYNAALTSSGDICAIRYELNHLRVFIGENAAFSLYRGIVDPRTSFLGDGSFDGFFANTDVKSTWEGNIEGAELTSASAPITVSNTIGAYSSQNRRNIYASNVVDFKVLFYARSSDGTVPAGIANPGLSGAGEVYPLEATNGDGFTDLSIKVQDGTLYIGADADKDDTPNYAATTHELVYADLEFAFLSSEGATVLQNHISGVESSFTTLDEIIERFGQRFTRRVGLNGSR